MPKRVVIFVDYQNAYHSARGLFHDHKADPPWMGQFDPLLFGEHILRSGNDPARTISQIRMYRGLPDSAKQPGSHGAATSQNSKWESLPNVKVKARPLRYPPGFPKFKPMEKGIDVQIALDFALMAVRGEYEVGVLMSGDTDLLPALEEVLNLTGAVVEVAAWRADAPPRHRLRLPGVPIRCHWIDRLAYQAMADSTDYTKRSR